MLRSIDAAIIELESYIDAFESAHAANLGPMVEDFLPAASHPQYGEIVGELLRIDLELRWQQGERTSLDCYRTRFADVLADPRKFERLAFEEYRMRCQEGEATTPHEYRDLYGIDASDWTSPAGPNGSRGHAPNGNGSGSRLGHSTTSSTNSHSSNSTTQATSFPQLGDDFPDFTLVEELGRGAFGRVYLARQRGLANRFVALKLTPGASVEPERLAQLQHENIVPIYSVHQADGLQAVCMPFLGRFTLADVLGRLRQQVVTPQSGLDLLSTVVAVGDATVVDQRDSRFARSAEPPEIATAPSAAGRVEVVRSIRNQFERSNYVDAVVWVTSQVAAGLAHAHERGILHRDLKPANILLADDGRPMLLDFNLSDRLRLPNERAAAVGGTLPYMAPEQLEALDTGVGIDARSDVYSLGVVLFELLTRRLPFPPLEPAAGKSFASLAAQRLKGAPSARRFNPWVPRSIDAVVAKCLASKADDRYQSAEDLRGDLDRHLANLPLEHAPNRSLAERVRKWMRRHPRLSSATSLGAAAAIALACVVGAWAARERGFALIAAKSNYQDFVAAAPLVQTPLSFAGVDVEALDEGIAAAQSQLNRFEVPQIAEWRSQPNYKLLSRGEQSDVDDRLGKTLYLLSSAFRRKAIAAASEADRRASLQDALKYNAQAAAILDRQSPALRATVQWQADEIKSALTGKASALPGERRIQSSTSDDEMAAIELIAAGRFSDAVPQLIAWRDRSPEDIAAWMLLGNAYAGLGNSSEAESCYTYCIARRPGYHFSYFQRGLARYELGRFQGAVDDFSKVLELGGCPVAARVNRGLGRFKLGDFSGALADLNVAIEGGRAPTRTYFIRTRVRHSLGDEAGAAQDFQQGLAATPGDATSWLVRGVARLSTDPEGALADFRRALALQPGSREALNNIVHVLADRLNRNEEAVQYLDAMIESNPNDARALASRAVARARLGKQDAAIVDAEAAVKIAAEPKLLMQAACVYALASRTQSDLIQNALTHLSKALGAEPALAGRAMSDPDLESLRSTEAFGRVIDAANVLLSHGASATTIDASSN